MMNRVVIRFSPDMPQPEAQTDLKATPSKGKRKRKYRSINGSSSGRVTQVKLMCSVDTTGCEWNQLPTFSPFVADLEGVDDEGKADISVLFIKAKDSCSSYIDLKTCNHETDIASGRVYRVYF
jgi:hypothetical protein